MEQLDAMAIRDRLPYEALVKLSPEQLAATVICTWDEVDAQQALLDAIGNDTGRSGIGYEIIHETNRFRVIASGPYNQLHRMAIKITKVTREYAKLLTAVAKVDFDVAGVYPPRKPNNKP